MGDVILATPLVRQLRATYPDAVIDVAVAERFADVWANNPRVNRVYAGTTPTGPYDLIVDLQANSRSRALRGAIPHKVSMLVRKHRLEKLALVYLKRRPAVVTPITDRYRQTVASLSLSVDGKGPEVWLPEDNPNAFFEDPREDTGSLLEHGRHYQSSEGPRVLTGKGFVLTGKVLQGTRVAVAPGAHHFTKRWPAEKFVELCKGLASQGAVPVLVGGVGDAELCAGIASAADCGVEDMSGAGTVQDTARILDNCALIVTNDTGVMHLATARRLPVVAIFGSTTGDLGFAPYGVPHTIVEDAIACRPCSHIGRSRCPRGHFLCMNAISADSVVAAAKELLSSVRKTSV